MNTNDGKYQNFQLSTIDDKQNDETKYSINSLKQPPRVMQNKM